MHGGPTGEQCLLEALMVGHRGEDVTTPRGRVTGVMSGALAVFLGLHTLAWFTAEGSDL